MMSARPDSVKGYGVYSNMYECKMAGFRECLNEVFKYLHREGVTNQNPVYQGLMDHLQYFYQGIATQAPYQQDSTSPIDSSFRYSHMQTPLTSFDNGTLPNYQDNYQKLSSWNSVIPSQYPNQGPQYSNQTNNYQTNFLFQRNAHQQNSQYPANIPMNPLISTNSNLNSAFKCSSTIPRIGLPTNAPIEQPGGATINFPTFGNDPITFFHSIQNPGQEIP